MIELKKPRRKIHTKVLPLSEAEYQVIALVAEGFSEKEIADQLCLSRDTIHTHTYKIRKKLNARCAVDIARKFILSLEDPKKYFAALTFLAIQFHIMLYAPDMDLRRPARTSTRVVRTSRKYEA